MKATNQHIKTSVSKLNWKDVLEIFFSHNNDILRQNRVKLWKVRIRELDRWLLLISNVYKLTLHPIEKAKTIINSFGR